MRIPAPAVLFAALAVATRAGAEITAGHLIYEIQDVTNRTTPLLPLASAAFAGASAPSPGSRLSTPQARLIGGLSAAADEVAGLAAAAAAPGPAAGAPLSVADAASVAAAWDEFFDDATAVLEVLRRGCSAASDGPGLHGTFAAQLHEILIGSLRRDLPVYARGVVARFGGAEAGTGPAAEMVRGLGRWDASVLNAELACYG